MTDEAIALLAPKIGTRAACRAVGVPQATWYRRHRISPPAAKAAAVPHADRIQPRALAPAERAAILEALHSERFADLAPDEVWATLLGTKYLEIHLGIYVVGGSGVAHESDIALLDGREAERSRRGLFHPRRSGLIASIEAKNYVVSPGIGVGRGFLGLSAEFGQSKCSLVFPARSSASLATLIARKPSESFAEVIPDSPASDRLQSHLDQAIRNWLA